MTKEDNGNFKNSTKCLVFYNGYIDNDVRDHYYRNIRYQVRDHCHTTGKCRGSAHQDPNINLKLNHKILVAFLNLKNFEQGKVNLKINVIPNGLEKYMSLNFNF